MTWLWWWCWLLLLLFLLFLDMMNDIGIDKKQQLYIIKKIINIAIRATYYIFCCRNRNWDSPDLMQFWYLLFFSFFGFCFVFLFVCVFLFFFIFNNPISSSVCKLPIRSEVYNCTFKNTNKVSIIRQSSSHQQHLLGCTDCLMGQCFPLKFCLSYILV